jgi:uncharacterized membrane protein
MADNATACPACGKAAGQSAGGGAAAAPATSSGGLTDNVAAGISYIFGILAIVFLLIDPYKNSKFVRFHCFQVLSLAVAWIGGMVALFAVALILSVVHLGFLIGILGPLYYLAVGVLGIVACIKAFQNQMWRIPVLGNFAAKFAGV